MIPEEQQAEVIAEATIRERRSFHLDKNINLSAVIGAIILLVTIVSYGNSILVELRELNTKNNIMWSFFVKDHPDYANLYPEKR